MSLIYHNGKFVPEQNIEKSVAADTVLRLLRSFLDANEPELVRILVNTFRSQGKAITYKELREAILNGDISAEYLDDWMQDYSRLVSTHMLPAWENAIETAAAELERRFPTWHFDPMGEGVKNWTATRSAEFVTSVTQTQIEGLRAVVRRAAVLEDMNVDQLARAIRSMVGLTQPQAVANMRYYETLIANGTSEKRALDLSMRYAGRQHRYRGYNIARQELAMAYNTGAHEGTKQAIAAGYLGQCVKVASCADDERVCSICGALDGAIVGMDENFSIQNKGRYRFTSKHPPFHIGCRCAVEYREIAPPRIKSE